MPRISIIVPAYNAQTHLRGCLDSATGQTFGDIEIVCVNDGSTDSTGAILTEYARADARVHVIEQGNNGPSRARNVGIESATGDYLVFLDSDDELHRCACERIVRELDTNRHLDAVVFGWDLIGEQASGWMKAHCDVPNASFYAFTPELVFELPTQPHLRLAVLRTALTEQGISFDEELRIGEDAAFLFAVYPRISGVQLISDKLYHYRLPHGGSVMNEIAEDRAMESLHHLSTAISVFGDWERDGLLKRYGAEIVCWSVKTALYTILRQEPPVRDELASTLGNLWRAHWTHDQLCVLNIPAHTRRLMQHALDIETPHLARDLVIYRLAEYGVADIAKTAWEKATRA